MYCAVRNSKCSFSYHTWWATLDVPFTVQYALFLVCLSDHSKENIYRNSSTARKKRGTL